MLEILEKGLLRVEPGLLLWTIITFVVLLLILWKTAWRPVVEALDARAEKVRSDIENADRARQEAEKLLAQHKAMMDNAKMKLQKSLLIAELRLRSSEMRSLKKQLLMLRTCQTGLREIDLAKDRALADLKAEIVNLYRNSCKDNQ